ncbi:MAG: Assymetric_cell_division_FstX [uncultured Microvirga sp.]|uniref:Assymetric_cell_division_FstX n=1 Tax=uncultured Microvirga sp. TaxID=412392 RepID=A0A6J4MIP3_9HYPH|nr:MAG: Assymetric_cell_division_FstX [uncultured Microvirga sp.]
MSRVAANALSVPDPDQGQGAEIAGGEGALKRGAPLVPVDTVAGRALVGVIAILTFLAALCAGAAELVATHSAQWQRSVAREATIQVKPVAQRSLESDVARAVELARASTGVASVRALSKVESERLLEPWLGAGLDLGDLPVPRLILVGLSDRSRPDLSELRRRLGTEVPTATLDDHQLWLSRLSTMAATLVGAGVGLVALVLAAAGLATAFATRGAMAGNRDAVDVLHFVGAHDRFIAAEFQRRFFRLGLKGGILGGGAALGLIALFGVLTRRWGENAAGDQIEALFGTFSLGWRGAAAIVAVIGVVAVVTGLVSRMAVRRFLRGAA